MRVLHFLPVYAPAWQFGGPILSVSRLCEGLVQLGVDVRVITTNAGLPDLPIEQLGNAQDLNGVKVFYYPVDHQQGKIRSRALVQALSEHMKWAEILHLSSIWQPLGLPVQKAAHAARVPVIQTLRGALGPYSWQRGWWKKIPYFYLRERVFLQRAAALHCTTSQEAREISWLRLKPPIHLLPNSLDFSKLHYNPELGRKWRNKIGLNASEPLFLVVGRLHHKKGLDLLPQTMQTISDRSWQLVFVGQDDDGTGYKLREAFTRLGLGDRCHWMNSIPSDQLIGPYNAADCLLLPSRHENFGNVVVEALACGSAVLISDSVGVGDSIRSCPGVRISSATKGAWSRNLTRVLDSSRPGQSSAKWVSDSFSKSLVASQAKFLYTSLLNNG